MNQGVVRGHVKKRVGSKYISDVELTWFAGSLHTECKSKKSRIALRFGSEQLEE